MRESTPPTTPAVPVRGEHRVLTLDQVAAWRGRPLILFVGISTGGSLVHTVFDRWAGLLGESWTLRGVDLPPDAAPRTYRRLLAILSGNPAVRGAVVTAHKLRLYRACGPDLARRDWLVDLTREVNALSASTTAATSAGTIAGAAVTGHARDAVSLTRILPGLVRRSAAGSLADLRVVCLGAGGAATALLLALHLDIDPDIDLDIDLDTDATPRPDPPPQVVWADTDPRALDDLRSVAARAGIDATGMSFVQVRDPRDGDALLADLDTPALVVNATGLGKDAPGSPVTGRARFGPDTLAWDLNYRGELTFLAQAAAGGARTVDGWDYFVAGWAGGLTAISNTANTADTVNTVNTAGTAFTGELLERFERAAAPHRPRPAG